MKWARGKCIEGVFSHQSIVALSCSNRSWIANLSFFSCKKWEMDSTKDFQILSVDPCIVFIKLPQGRLQGCGEGEIGWDSCHIPCPFLTLRPSQEEGLLRCLNSLPRAQLSLSISFSKRTHTVLKIKWDFKPACCNSIYFPKFLMFLSFCLCLDYFCAKSNLGDNLYLWKFSPSLKLQVKKYLFPWKLPLSSLSPSPTLAHCPLYQSLPFINLWDIVVCV